MGMPTALTSPSNSSIDTREAIGRWNLTRRTIIANGSEASLDVVFISSASVQSICTAGSGDRLRAHDAWPTRCGEDMLASFLALHDQVVCVGAKRLTRDSGHVFSVGEFIIHPKGFHHHGRGVDARCFRFPEEVDLIAGGLIAIDGRAFDEANGGEALAMGTLGTIELGLRLREHGGRVIAIPQVSVCDEASPEPTPDEEQAFAKRWGFEWRCVDLDAVRDRARSRDQREEAESSGLLWNVRLHLPQPNLDLPFEKYVEREAMHWVSYREAEPYRQRADHLASIAAKVTPSAAGQQPGRILDLGCGDGLFAHLFAKHGLAVTGLDPEEAGLEQARARCAPEAYPGDAPEFVLGRGDRTGFPDEAFDAIAMLDVIEHLPNPIVVLKEAARLLRQGGRLLISTPAWQFGGWSDPVYHVTEYTMNELVAQVTAAGGLRVIETGMIKGIYRDLIVIAERTG